MGASLRAHGGGEGAGLRTFAERAEAFILACPDRTRADWLIVETSPGEGPPRVEVFVDNRFAEEREHPRVTLLGVATAPTASASMSVPAASDACASPQGVADCSALNAQGTRWIGRHLSTGMLRGPHWLHTLELAQVGERATLAVYEQIADKRPANGAAWDWRCKHSAQLAGTAVKRDKQLVFRFAAPSRPSDVHEVICKPRQVRVAAASAVRVPVPPPLTEEGCNKHRWSPKATLVQRALECSNSPFWPSSTDVVFAGAPPGIEHITLDEDDCGDPAESLRLMPSNHTVAPVESPRRP